ncbi:MAG: 2-oxo acid dehydrogenase subunit E2 [Sphingobacteriales bacterium JAD_PAG50586_3]|nr:MAG: 2-oxo acid dehydrogenase subunit E2 [Sphingobacteriales bacterium JAD_PAG50586_3]
MAQFNLTMPKMGESVHEATIIKWLKNEGDSIELDEPVLEIATDKVDSEIPSPVAGILGKKLFNDGDVIQVGSAIAVIETEGGAGAGVADVAAAPVAAEAVEATVNTAVETAAPAAVAEVGASPSGRFYSPLVKSIAKQENIGIDELETIAGTGKDGRLTKDDIIAYLPNRGKNGAPAVKPQPQAQPQSKPAAQPVNIQAPAVSLQGGDEIIEMDRMGKLIAEHMVMSKHVSPHVTSFVEADVTNIVLWRDRIKKDFEKREGEKITFTPIFIEAVCKAIKDFPMINISVDGTNIIIRKNINIGMATALPNGNLIVPVIKNVDRMNLVGITKAVNDLANRARNNKLTPDDISGGTYTLTNVGSFGNVMGTPIINQPQVAIMAVGAVRKKPAVIETPTGDAIAIRHMMFLSHSYDHRVVNGALGGQFVRRVADYLEQFDFNREF